MVFLRLPALTLGLLFVATTLPRGDTRLLLDTDVRGLFAAAGPFEEATLFLGDGLDLA